MSVDRIFNIFFIISCYDAIKWYTQPCIIIPLLYYCHWTLSLLSHTLVFPKRWNIVKTILLRSSFMSLTQVYFSEWNIQSTNCTHVTYTAQDSWMTFHIYILLQRNCRTATIFHIVAVQLYSQYKRHLVYYNVLSSLTKYNYIAHKSLTNREYCY